MERRIIRGLSDEGLALVAEILANDEINLDAIMAYVARTEQPRPAEEDEA